ncbi:glycosyltransferase family 4 protein [Subsaximicrobium wynnwilliamsii]|uniref:Glycosyltransferase family 4 protein n=1 Tax=Subsaximicrobium wynnwilliamsii TaxID=291179 RepID=A0A5C6ZFB9_9FLAO|nr:glycosyltransferase family 4 protein [Subsaximicrobium wynnwilliamsii]TXD81680.1 glycosyltransferase family 4 protein [Subsaximicrobium wynnwilliamsii]TXD87435.1 glycosyltransferase family 4 protein [Subsaximicrobium wynnwilliamsii]TXE01123.1 glycosyltransferase family 4 protein [Subsaximicrobium wynnwilliamsii]
MKNLLYLGNNLNRANANVSVMGTLGPLLEQEGFGLIYASSKSNKVLRLWDMVWTLISKRKHVDLILIDTYSTQNFYYALVTSQLARLFGLGYLPILHGGNLPARLENSPRLSRMLFANAKVNVAPSLYLKSAFEAQGYTNISYIPNSIALDQYPVIKKEYAQPKLLWVRSFAALYNPNMAVQVLAGLRAKGYEASLCMIGPDKDGAFQNTKDLATQLQVEVAFTGKLTKPEWIEKSKAYNIFINTSTVDNMPVSVIEAMALGFPVVSTNVGGMPYLIADGENGILVDNGDVAGMVNAIVGLFEDEGRLELLSANARAFAGQFDWFEVRGRWMSVIEGT